MGAFADSLAGVEQLLAQRQLDGDDPRLRPLGPTGPPGPRDSLGARHYGLAGLLRDAGMDFVDDALLDPSQVEFRGMGSTDRGLWGQPAAGGGGGGGSWTPNPPGQDLHGRDLSPDLVNFQGVETTPAYARLIKAAEVALGMPGISDAAGSDYRSHDEQVALYADHLAGRHPAPVAPPGQSYHEQGEAIDWDSGWLAQNPQVRKFFTDHGVTFDVPGEPWHGHLAQMPHVGAILNGGPDRGPRRQAPAQSPVASRRYK